ncbi:MAG: hypothetical protein ACRECO_15050 [Xanthobacteraceae bacterium]
MRIRHVLLSLSAALLAIPVAASAQWPNSPSQQQQQVQWPDPPRSQSTPRAKQPPRQAQQQDVEELTPGQIRRAQEAAEKGSGAGKAESGPKKAKPKPKATAARSVTCGGPFAKNSSHLRLAQAFGSLNITFTQVDGPGNTKLMASVLFPKDPRRRLEVLWENEAARSNTQLIVINGKSAWSAPKGLRLGLTLTALEKLNRKPFKLTGFDRNSSSILDWQGGALASLPGGCKVGMRLSMNSRAPEDARKQIAGKKELVSSDTSVRKVQPAVVEILLGY